MSQNDKTVTVETEYTYQETKAFLRFQRRKMRRMTWILLALLVVGIATMLFFTVGLDGSWGGVDLLWFPVGAAFVMVTLPLLLLSGNGAFYTRRTHKKAGQNRQSTSFLGGVVCFRNTGSDFEEEYEVPYTDLQRVWETKDMFYLYTDKQAFLVSKAGFTSGKPEKLRAFLGRKLGDRYKTVSAVSKEIAKSI